MAEETHKNETPLPELRWSRRGPSTTVLQQRFCIETVTYNVGDLYRVQVGRSVAYEWRDVPMTSERPKAGGEPPQAHSSTGEREYEYVEGVAVAYSDPDNVIAPTSSTEGKGGR